MTLTRNSLLRYASVAAIILVFIILAIPVTAQTQGTEQRDPLPQLPRFMRTILVSHFKKLYTV